MNSKIRHGHRRETNPRGRKAKHDLQSPHPLLQFPPSANKAANPALQFNIPFRLSLYPYTLHPSLIIDHSVSCTIPIIPLFARNVAAWPDLESGDNKTIRVEAACETQASSDVSISERRDACAGSATISWLEAPRRGAKERRSAREGDRTRWRERERVAERRWREREGAMPRRRELEKEGLRTRPSGISSDVEGDLVASYTHVFGNVRGCP